MKGVIALSVVILSLLAVGVMDYSDAQEYDAYKCDMVKSGAWPESVLDGVECK